MSVEARLNMPLGGAAAQHGAAQQEEQLHITLDEQRPPAKRPLTAAEQRAIALGRAEAPGGYQPNGRSPALARAAPAPPAGPRPRGAQPAPPPPPRAGDQRLYTTGR